MGVKTVKTVLTVLMKERLLFLSGNVELLCEQMRQLRGEIFKAKLNYKNKTNF